MTNAPRHRRLLLVILVLGLLLRLAYGFTQDRVHLYERNQGDSWWYLQYGRMLVVGEEPGPPPSGPAYLVFVGLPHNLFAPPHILKYRPTYLAKAGIIPDMSGESTAILTLRIVQALLSTATAYFAYRLAWIISKNERAGLIAAAVLAFSPVFILESAQILTETLYLFLISGGILLYILATTQTTRRVLWLMAGVGAILGVATLTRAVLLAFPIGLAIHLFMVSGWRKGFQRAAVLLAVYALVVSTWTVYMKATWDLWVVGAQGFSAFLYLGTTDWQGPSQVDASLSQHAGEENFSTEPDDQQQLYQQAAVGSIFANPLGWIKHRASELANAYLQPHGTTFFPGEGLKELATQWWSNDRTLTGLIQLTNGDAFWPKLLIYILHFAALGLGLLGMLLTWREWRVTLPLIGLILYTSLIHFALDAIPRYIFPVEVFFWCFAAAAIVAVSRQPAAVSQQPQILTAADS